MAELSASIVLETETRNSPEKQTQLTAAPKARSFDAALILRTLGILAVIAGIVAVARVCQIIQDVGGNNISNDYLDVVPFIDRALSGQVQFGSITDIADNFKVGQHLVAMPMLFHFLSAYFFDWNARAELFVGVGINLIKTFLIWDIVASSQRKEWRLLLLGAVLALVFSMTQASVHFFGQACYPVSLTTLGFTVALWGIFRFKSDWRSVLFMLAGGIGAAASMGNVVPCWSALLAGLILYGYRLNRWPVYAAWLAGAAVSIAPYVYFLFGHARAAGQIHHALDLTFIINLLGRPFANQVGLEVGRLPMAEFVGIFGLVAFALAVTANLRLKHFDMPVRSALIFCVYGLVSAVVLSAVRVFVTPWYGAFAIYFWIGVIGLLIAAVSANLSKTTKRPLDTVFATSCLVCLAAIPIIYCASNRSWEDKHVYLYTRSFASESALRNFRHAPSYIESLLFQWGDGRPENVLKLALPLERHRLSAFAPDQTWSLQGDFVLPGVRVFNNSDFAPVRFIENITVDHPVPWSHYEKANLYLHAPNTVSWDVFIPDLAQSAKLESAFTIGAPARGKHADITDGAVAKVYAVLRDEKSKEKHLLKEVAASKEGQWQPFELDLSAYRGKPLALIFTADGGKNKSDDYAVFKYPHIDVKLPRANGIETTMANKPWLPTNTDLNPDFGKNFEQVVELPLPTSSPASEWRCAPLEIATPSDIRGATSDSVHKYTALFYTPEKSIAAADFTHLLFQMQAPKTMAWRSLKVSLVLKNGKPCSFSVPLPADEKVHVCSYDLKLCEFPQNAVIKQVVLYPVAAPGSQATDAITVSKVSLAREKPPDWRGILTTSQKAYKNEKQ